MEIEQLQKEITAIKLRNKKVEADKAWETSFLRKLAIFVLTYFVIVLFMYFAKINNAFINAIVPAIGFFLSTLTLPIIKRWWIKQYAK